MLNSDWPSQKGLAWVGVRVRLGVREGERGEGGRQSRGGLDVHTRQVFKPAKKEK